MIDVVVVDDDTDAVQALSDLCASTGDLCFVGGAASASEGISLVQRVSPDVVLADIRMPGPDGVVLTRSLTSAGRDLSPRVIILTAFPLDDYLLGALAAGASGFLPKSASWAEISDAIRAVHEGAAVLAPILTRRLLDLIMAPDGESVALTRRETEVLALLGAGCSNAQIAERCFVSVGTVRSHVEHLRAKLGLSSRVELALAARRRGLGYGNGAQTPASR